MSHQCLYIEQNVSGGCLLGRQFVVDNDGFANQQGWMTDDQIDYLATAAGTTDTFQGSDKWVLANGEHGSCFIEPQFDPAGGQQFLSNDPMLPDAETESLSGDRRVSSSSTDSNGSDLWPAANVWDAFAPAPHSGTTEAPGRGAYKTRWLCHECGHEFPTSQKLETHAKSVQHKAYVCKACKKGFSRRDTYGRHVVTHRVSAGLHQCEVCKAQNVELLFKRKDHLEQHKRNKHFKPIIRGNIRSDRYGSGDDLVDSRSAADSYVSSCLELEADVDSLRESEKQDITSALQRIISKAASGMDINSTIPYSDSPLENARLLRGFALLALYPPEKLPPVAKEQLKEAVDKLERIDLRSCI